MRHSWDDACFGKVTGNRVYLLLATDGPHSVVFSPADGKTRWIVTKGVWANGKYMCWCIPVEAKNGPTITVTLTESNAFDLGAAYDAALRESDQEK